MLSGLTDIFVSPEPIPELPRGTTTTLLSATTIEFIMKKVPTIPMENK